MAPKKMTWTRVTVAALGLVAAAGLGLGLASGVPARADGASKKDKTSNRKPARPKIDEVKPAEAFSGGQVILAGSGFSIFATEADLEDIKAYREALAAVKATIGGETAQAQSISDGELALSVPFGLKKGKARIEVTIDGKSASGEVNIVDEGMRKEKRDEDQKRESGETLPSADFLTLDLPQSSIDRGKTVISFTGKAEGLPEGAVINLKLTLGSEDVDTTSAEVKGGGSFGGKFGAYEKALYPGQYWVEARFEARKQSIGFRKKFDEAFKGDPKVAKQHERAGARQPVNVGSAEQTEAQQKELKGNAASTIVRAKEILTEIAVAYGSAGRSGFVSGGGKVDEGAWEAWLEKHAYKAFPPADKAKRLKEMQVKRDFLSGSSAFADGRWREFIDAKREEIVARLKEHDAYRGRFLVVRDAEGLQKMGQIWVQLQDIAINWSRELYENAKVPPDAKDPAISARSAGQVLVDLAWIEKHFLSEQPPGK